MKRIIAFLLVLILFILNVPYVNALESYIIENGVINDISCLESDLPHGDVIWKDIVSLEESSVPENAFAGMYSSLIGQIKKIIVSSNEYLDNSLI